MQIIMPARATLTHWDVLFTTLFAATIILVINLSRLKGFWKVLAILNEKFWIWIYRVVFTDMGFRRQVPAGNEYGNEESDMELEDHGDRGIWVDSGEV